jgi:hypothetical protein
MSQPAFDPYLEWLGIEPQDQPADFYQLLGVARFEEERPRIAQAADERMAYVRSFQTGPRGAATQKLLNELAAARVCLLDPRSKAEYDAALARHLDERAAERRARTTPPAPRQHVSALPPCGAVEPSLVTQSPASEHQRGRNAGRREAMILALSGMLAVTIGAGGWFLGRLSRNDRPTNAARGSQWPGAGRDEVPVEPKKMSSVVAANSTDELAFALGSAELTGEARLQTLEGEELLTGWGSPDDGAAAWQFHTAKPGFFRLELVYSTGGGVEDAELEVVIDERARACSLRSSGGLDRFLADTYIFAVPRSGQHMLTIRPRTRAATRWLVVKSVRFIPVRANLTPGEP